MGGYERILKPIVERCRGCSRHDGGYCIGWDDPAFMWRDGHCEFYSSAPNLKDRIGEAIKRYSGKRKS